MCESFGARLRQRREEQQIALTTIAQKTKIKRSMLEALERDDVSHWPSGIFRRSFVRSYAHAIGLDADAVVREFLEIDPDPPEALASPWDGPSAADAARTSGAPPSRLRYLVGSALGSLTWRRRSGAPAHLTVVERPPIDLAPAAPASGPEPDVPVAKVEWTAGPGEGDSRERASEIARPAFVDPAVPDPPDLQAIANLCTDFACADEVSDMQPLLEEAARLLGASGLIVWMWDELAAELRPVLVYGYSANVIAHLPRVRRDAENPTASAFRTGQTRAIGARDEAAGALVVPLLSSAGCSGVLAVELRRDTEQSGPVRAMAAIVAALLAQCLGAARFEDVPAEPVRVSG